MKIGGFQKFSLIDYPGKISAVIFVQGCNFRCHYCHNRDLVLPEYFSKTIPEEEIIDFLSLRKGKLQGVVITGGEPTIFPDLPDFIYKIKKMGFYIKLDTNGSNPDMLSLLIERKLVDFVAMDIKAPVEKYGEITGASVDKNKIIQSIDILKNSGVHYEFRTTVVKGLISEIDLYRIANLIKGAVRYAVQNFHPVETVVNENFKKQEGYSKNQLKDIEKKLKSKFPQFIVRA
ncbi:pyruvate formate lyase activating enzyme [Persephonella hydrogeniphila]|uniref:Pyruvate formate lyase activating enzyme n=1 Tax=Persephonella hydrogeniphila TaxID=198703 RepID=A0A285NCH6_9AQUI|nr:anaerobic ribonucleoside-triphosphate reductase activating protein [Persephonella hydrogeniphila]SNZ07150.1 pyruvate formate lyase activating enzyme [Persephonella hydrogeniphila]